MVILVSSKFLIQHGDLIDVATKIDHFTNTYSRYEVSKQSRELPFTEHSTACNLKSSQKTQHSNSTKKVKALDKNVIINNDLKKRIKKEEENIQSLFNGRNQRLKCLKNERELTVEKIMEEDCRVCLNGFRRLEIDGVEN